MIKDINIIKNYPPKGPFKQYRLQDLHSFTCHRCNSQKKSKMITNYKDNWSMIFCNGCVGLLVKKNSNLMNRQSLQESLFSFFYQ